MYRIFVVTTILCLTLECSTAKVKNSPSDIVIDGSSTNLPPITDITTSGDTPTSIPPEPTKPSTLPNNGTNVTTTVSPPTPLTTKVTTTTVKPTTSTTTITPTTPNTTSTVIPPTTTPATTTTPSSKNVTTTTPPPHQDRKFDGPSFIGGIILASGLMAIGFVAWKFYKARTERNYHTL